MPDFTLYVSIRVITRVSDSELLLAGLDDVIIAATSNLDEYKIANLEEQDAPIDSYGAVTEIINVADRPVLEAVYKLAETIDSSGAVQYTANESA